MHNSKFVAGIDLYLQFDVANGIGYKKYVHRFLVKCIRKQVCED